MIRAVLDANVVVAAMLSPRGAPARIVALAGVAYTLVWSPPILEECLRVVGYPRLRGRFRVREPRALLADLADAAALVEQPLPELRVVPGDPADDVYVATALVGAASRVVSGDRRHLLRLRAFAGVRMVAPAEFLAELGEGGA